MKRYLNTILTLLVALIIALPTYAAPPAKKSDNKKKTNTTAVRKTNQKNNAKKPAARTQNNTRTNNKSAKKEKEERQPVYRPDDFHHFIMWGGAGYSGLVNGYDMGTWGKHSFIGGGGGLIGLGYEYHHKRFQLYVGPELRLFTSQDKMLYNQPYEIPSTADGYPQTYRYYFADTKGNYRALDETNIVGQAMLPLMFGATFDKIYFMAGAKFGYTFMSPYVQNGTLTTTISDNWAFDDNWYQIGHNTQSTRGNIFKGANQFSLDAAASLEVGVVLDEFLPIEFQDENQRAKHPWHFRVAAFLDYGFLNMNIAQTNKEFAVVDPSKVAEDKTHGMTTTSVHQSSWASNKAVNSLLAGVKFTALLQLNKPVKPKPANPYLVVRLINARTGQPLSSAQARNVTAVVTDMQKGREYKRRLDSKAMAVQRYAPGDYQVAVAHPDFLPAEPFTVTLLPETNNNLKERLDTTFILLNPIPVTKLHIVNNKTGEPINANVAIVDTVDGKVLTTLKHEKGRAEVTYELPVDRFYRAIITAKGFHEETFDIGLQGLDDIEHTFALAPIEKGFTFILDNLFFATNKTDILPQSEPTLEELFRILTENPTIRVRITGHTDSVGSDEDNQILSEGRAASVKQSMIDRGIDPDRMETEGKGESMPIATNDTEEGRQLNRRVEVTIL